MKFQLNKIKSRGLLPLFFFPVLAIGAAPPEDVERSYFGDLPVVLSVTRLAQSLADTPGAVTVLDRDMIRKSGVRDVAELLRFVPGFISGRMGNGAHPTASYHASLDTLYGSRHMQVFVDGRSIYSSVFIGDTHTGLMGVVLEDVERIEVLRGSNSAAYGANAFLGVINIVTRSAMDTHGGLISATGGNQGVNDQVIRVGGGNSAASFRVTAARRDDDGSEPFGSHQAYDDRNLRMFHFRGDLLLNSDNDVLIEAGATNNISGAGRGDVIDFDPFRDETTKNRYFQVRWSHDVSAKESLMLTAQLDEDEHEDNVYNPFIPSIGGVTGSSRRQNVEIQHTQQYSDTVRAVIGAALRHEMVRGLYMFGNEDKYTQNQKRLFGNIEWFVAPDWVVNAGGLYENNSVIGSEFSPRLMLNHHLTPDHTFRIGATRATRTPSIVELQARFQMLDPATGRPVVDPFTGLPFPPYFLGDSQLKEESIRSQEIGYLGNFPAWHLNLDLRLFREDIRDIVDLPQISKNPSQWIFVNAHSMKTEGLEQQWRWRPREGTQFIFNHTYTRINSNEAINESRAPRISHSGMWFQQLPLGMDFSLMYTHVQEMNFGITAADKVPGYNQVDVRLAYPFRIGSTRAELAIVSQAINGSHLEDTGNIRYTHRTYSTLRLEF